MARASAFRSLETFVPAHGPEVADLWVETWTRAMPAIDFEARRAWFVDHLSAGIAAGTVVRLAMMDTGAVAGFVMIDPRTGYLDQIAVHPDFLGAGIASRLLAEARRLSPAGITLDVNLDNARAVAFYRREGFVEIAEGINPRSGLKTLKLRWTPAS